MPKSYSNNKNKKYQTHDFKIFSGASIGGLLALHSLQSRPHLFQAHMAYSPAVWWGDHTTSKKTKAFMSQTKSVNNYLYMNIGEEAGFMRDVYDDLHAFLQNNKPEEFKFITHSFDSVPHGLTSSAGAYQGLAFGYERQGNYKDALEQANLALKLSKAGDSGHEILIKRIDRLTLLVNVPEK